MKHRSKQAKVAQQGRRAAVWVVLGLAGTVLASAQQTVPAQQAGSQQTAPMQQTLPGVGPNVMVAPGFVPAKFRPRLQQPAVAGAGSAALLSAFGSDSCATADPISGVGVFPFDNSAATTGPHGQGLCAQLGSASTAFDVWFVWTAPATGVVLVSTCGLTTVDTRVLFWDKLVAGGCPFNGAGLRACNDDLSPSIDQSKVVSDVVAGREYLVQLGTYGGSPPSPPAVGGVGAFSIDYLPLPDPTPCFADNGDSEAAVGVAFHPAYGQCMLVRHGTVGLSARVSAIEVAWGSPVNAAASTLVNGTRTSVALWEDPNDDGNPDDALLLEEQRTTVQNHDTDILNVVPLRSTYLVSGYYFVGAIYPSDPGYPTSVGPTPYPFALDWDNLEVLPGDLAGTLSLAQYYQLIYRTFFVLHFGSVDAAHLGYVGDSFSNVYIGGVASGNYAYNNIALIRPVCAPEVGQSICSADTLGLDHATLCPCGNSGNSGNGCANSFNSAGARIVAYGDILDDTFPAPGRTPVVLRASGLPATSFTMFLQHDSAGDTIFHDGVLCASGSLIRLRGRSAGVSAFQPAGVALFPNNAFSNDSTLTLSSRGNVTVGSGLTRYYSAWYRNASQSFCPPATANVTNGWVISW